MYTDTIVSIYCFSLSREHIFTASLVVSIYEPIRSTSAGRVGEEGERQSESMCYGMFVSDSLVFYCH